jgi:hypothetical protein
LVANNIITDYNIGVNVQEYEDYFMMGENQKALGVLRRNIYRGPSIDASYQVSVHLTKRFQRRQFLKIGQSETRMACGVHVC